MCGIAGYVGDSPQAEQIIRAMTDSMARRGPDACGLEKWPDCVFGHRRLAIFDLSEAGLQPMLTPDRSAGVVFNGAIYNFPQLRAELESKGYRFRSRTDTEVILHGYDAWGFDEMVGRLRGMFTIGLWDQRRRTLFLARDRLGVKPLVYACDGASVAFASTVRAVAVSGLGGEIDEHAVTEFLDYGFITDGRTIFDKIRKVPAATIIEFSEGRERRRSCYWQPAEASPARSISFADAVGEAERLFLEAVRIRLDADVPVGSLLSGGVDSSLVCWAIAKLGGNIRAFTIGTPGDDQDETADATATARQLNIDHSVIEVSADDAPDLAELTDAYGEPFACSSALGMLRVSRAVRSSATVLLTGDGGDDCFLGYPEHKNFYLAQRVANRLPSAIASVWKAGSHRSSLPTPLRRAAHFLDFATGGIGAVARVHDGLNYYQRHGLLGARLKDARTERRDIGLSIASARNLLQEFLRYDRDTRFTGEYLAKVDGGSMYYALEARSPFLDQELWNFAQSLPFDVRLRGGRLKAVLRAIAARRLGDRVANGRKRGFGIPVNRWLTGRWKKTVNDLLSDSVLERDGWLNAGACRRRLEDASASGRVSNQLWYIAVLESWLRRQARDFRTAAAPVDSLA